MIKAKNEPKIWDNVVIRSVLFLLVICGVLFSCFYFAFLDPNTTCFGALIPTYDNVEETANLRFPPSASNIEFMAYSVNDGCDVYVKFEMDAEDFEQFKSSTQFENFAIAQLGGSTFNYAAKKVGWTQPVGSLAAESGMQWVYIDTQNDRWIVYLITVIWWD